MAKIGPNESCLCGSDKEYQNCCPRKEDLDPHTKPTEVNRIDSLNILMHEGYTLIKKELYSEACMVWLEMWNKLKLRFTSDIRSITDLDNKFNFPGLLYNWCQDLEEELRHVAEVDSSFFYKRLAYCNEFAALLPYSSDLILVNMKRAAAECYFFMGKVSEGEATFEETIRTYPNAATAYINWGDMYGLGSPCGMTANYERAEKIYRMALERDLDEPDAVRSRLNDLYELMERG